MLHLVERSINENTPSGLKAWIDGVAQQGFWGCRADRDDHLILPLEALEGMTASSLDRRRSKQKTFTGRTIGDVLQRKNRGDAELSSEREEVDRRGGVIHGSTPRMEL